MQAILMQIDIYGFNILLKVLSIAHTSNKTDIQSKIFYYIKSYLAKDVGKMKNFLKQVDKKGYNFLLRNFNNKRSDKTWVQIFRYINKYLANDEYIMVNLLTQVNGKGENIFFKALSMGNNVGMFTLFSPY